jgi:hypothetical protein
MFFILKFSKIVSKKQFNKDSLTFYLFPSTSDSTQGKEITNRSVGYLNFFG